MDYDRFKPNPEPEAPPEDAKLYEPAPVKDYSFMVNKTGRQPQPTHKVRMIIIAVVVVILVVGGSLLLAKHSTKPKPAPPKATSTSKSSSVKTPSPAKIQTTSYDSANFSLSLNYPDGWTVAGDTPALLTVESPAKPLTAASGQTVTGKIIMNIQPTGQIPAAFGTADAEAVLPSQLIKYTTPTADQRAQTYLSFVQYAATTTKGALDGIYITGNDGYQKDQTIPRTDLAGLNPLVTVTFGSCATTACTSLTAINIPASAWSNSSFQLPIVTLLKSLSFD